MSPPICPRCNAPFRLDMFFEAVAGYSTVTDSGGSSCPECHESLEFRVASESLELGFTYWAGSLHFDAIQAFRVAGLRLVSKGENVAIELRGRVYDIPSPRPAATRE